MLPETEVESMTESISVVDSVTDNVEVPVNDECTNGTLHEEEMNDIHDFEDAMKFDDADVPPPISAVAIKRQKVKRMKRKKRGPSVNGMEPPGEQVFVSKIPLSVTMPSTSRKSLHLCVSSNRKKVAPNQVQSNKPAKFKCPPKSISSSFKVTSVPPSMVFKMTNMKAPNAKCIDADGFWQDIPDAYLINDGEEQGNCDSQHDTTITNPLEENEYALGEDDPKLNLDAKFHFLFGNVILHLKHPCSFPFWGQLQVEVIKGAVEVLGYILNPRKGPQVVFSPRGSSFLSVQTVVAEDQDLCNVSFMDIDSSEITSLFETGGENDAWMLLRKVDSILPAFLDRYLPFKVFPSANIIERDQSFPKAAKKLHCVFDIRSQSNCFEKGNQWDVLHDRVSTSGCTVLCGGKGVGKSTMLRFLVNRLLNNCDKPVILLDFDPGQAELTMPGCLSASIVSKPLLGPNFTHLQKTEKCIYIGDINVSNCVTRYMDACASLINFWRSEPSFNGIPCLVNTMGFTQGLGVTLMVQLLSLLKPNLVIQIDSSIASHNFPDLLSVDYVKRNCSSSPFTSDVDAHFFDMGARLFCPSSIRYDLLFLKAVREKGQDKTFGPRQHREIVIMSYLSQAASSSSQSILDVVPFSRPMKELYLNVCHETVDPSLTLSVINASLVALCNASPCQEDVVQAPTPGVPAVIKRPLTADCYGFGIVRGIDMDTKYLYITTPLNSDQLASVNCLVLGAVNLPASMLLRPPKESGPVPYVTVVRSSVDSIGSKQAVSLNPLFTQ